MNESPGNLTGYDCPECRNKGVTYTVDKDGHIIARKCKCWAIRRSLRYMEASGLAELLKRCTFDTWQTPERWQGAALDKAKQYAENPVGWLAVCGKSGTGKTHLCTAVCGRLMERGVEVRYMLWRDAATRLKTNATYDISSYNSEIEPLKKVRCLYIDDLFKIGCRQKPTVMDVNLAFEIINARYIDGKLITVISSEFTLEEIMSIDNATGSRIYERTKPNRNYFNFSNQGNWRTGGQNG